jgi:glucose/arabinose dehydrogenase
MSPSTRIVHAWRHAEALLVGCALAACAASEAPVVTGDPTIQLVASQLSSPLLVTAPPGDTARVFIVEQTGRIRIVRNDTLLPTAFLNVSALISCCGEQGLLGLAFHPQYATNGYFYVNYTNAAGNTQVVRYHVSSNPDSADAASASPVLSQAQPFPNHNGGMLAFGPDGFLYVGLGDGGSGGDPQGNGQNLGTWLGKILRIDVSGAGPYAVPPSNPFVGRAGALPEIWAWGLRNPWRFSFDRLTGDLYIGDVGQSAFEEIDVEVAPSAGGRNYGWNVMEGKSCYAAATCVTTGLTLPVLDYPHTQGCSVTGGYVYRGTRLPALAGMYLFADYCNGWVHGIRPLIGSVFKVTDWPRLAPGGTISSFGEDARGELYVVSHQPGAVFRIVPASP